MVPELSIQTRLQVQTSSLQVQPHVHQSKLRVQTLDGLRAAAGVQADNAGQSRKVQLVEKVNVF